MWSFSIKDSNEGVSLRGQNVGQKGLVGHASCPKTRHWSNKPAARLKPPPMTARVNQRAPPTESLNCAMVHYGREAFGSMRANEWEKGARRQLRGKLVERGTRHHGDL